MLNKTDRQLIKRALHTLSLVKETEFGNVVAAHVGAALITDKGKVYTGVNIDCKCNIGSCAEHNAIADMIKNGEHSIKTIVALSRNGTIVPPCGRCRELIYQVTHDHNVNIIVPKNRRLTLKKLLPNIWEETYYTHKK